MQLIIFYNVYIFIQIDVLEEVVEAVGDKIEVYFDGGIRRGTDVFKALARGAKAVFIGRLSLWGLAYKVCFSCGRGSCMHSRSKMSVIVIYFLS